MDFATLIGLFGSITLVLGSIMLGGSLTAFVDIPSIGIVLGGGSMTVLTSMPLGPVLGTFKVITKAIFVQLPDPKSLVTQMVEFAVVARRDGILALESKIEPTTHPFVASGIRMAVDGTDPELVEKLMTAEIESLADRHKKGRQVVELFGKYAPAYGMIGTLIGLVQMLGNLSDPSTIGPNMAVALLTTLYGALIANAVCLPLADKLAYYSRQELSACTMILQGVLAIQSGDNPRVVEQKLGVFLPPKDRNAQG